MAIRNKNLGGSNWGGGDALKAEDLNDTFNRIVEIVDNGN